MAAGIALYNHVAGDYMTDTGTGVVVYGGCHDGSSHYFLQRYYINVAAWTPDGFSFHTQFDMRTPIPNLNYLTGIEVMGNGILIVAYWEVVVVGKTSIQYRRCGFFDMETNRVTVFFSQTIGVSGGPIKDITLTPTHIVILYTNNTGGQEVTRRNIQSGNTGTASVPSNYFGMAARHDGFTMVATSGGVYYVDQDFNRRGPAVGSAPHGFVQAAYYPRQARAGYKFDLRRRDRSADAELLVIHAT